MSRSNLWQSDSSYRQGSKSATNEDTSRVAASGSDAAQGGSAAHSSGSDSAQEVFESVGRSVAAGCEGGLPDLPLAGNARLIASYRAAKKEVLWGVCGKAVAGTVNTEGGSEQSSVGGSGLETLVLPARNSLHRRGEQEGR